MDLKEHRHFMPPRDGTNGIFLRMMQIVVANKECVVFTPQPTF